MRFPLALVLTLMAAAAAAGDAVYKWVDDKGVTHYTDKPPNKAAKPLRLPGLQTFSARTLPAGGATQPKSAGAYEAAAAARRVTVISPGPDQAFPAEIKAIPISVTLSSPLAEGYGLVYYLDSAPRNQPTQSLTFLLANVSRGSHLAAVAIVDSRGTEIARSHPVMFHLKPSGPVAELQPTRQ